MYFCSKLGKQTKQKDTKMQNTLIPNTTKNLIINKTQVTKNNKTMYDNMMKKMYPTAAILSFTIALTACNETNNNTPTGTWTDTANSEKTFLQLKDDGSLTGSDGCNNITGNWENKDDTIQISLLASTMMLCEDNNDWLLQTKTAKINNGNMNLEDSQQNIIGTLQKK